MQKRCYVVLSAITKSIESQRALSLVGLIHDKMNILQFILVYT
jgi:hypothetical protein